ncbi:zinc-binding dehydrogenase [Xylophilus sp. GOD-11R]|uniref:zinc-binding dehydrogenase n=1 Tax=Xylophilus sp. GOD-11R TaxID=3089814 RepID=UPI00298C9EBE|nr:zinc-binding dehydrogenase [Xylophilus sp. GOD-11R]WPB55047.1 zinc-binding dehydrogenase [Xylophilus sp. GOD-11R]
MSTDFTDSHTTALQLRSLITADGRLQVSLEPVPVPEPADNEVLVRLQAAPINPSDLGLLFGAADLSTLQAGDNGDLPTITARVPDAAMKSMAGRAGQSMPVGNEGAGRVVRAGASPAAQALLGKTVAVIGGAAYAQYRAVPVEQCLLLPEGASARDGASSFVNPLTALGMVETMKREGHHALVHTAAASNLGRMLHRICAKDGIALVNIVRKPEQVELLRSLGATHVCDSSASDFLPKLTDALAATGATIAFDATGGGPLGGQILSCMESALSRRGEPYSRYGSSTHKQVYLYGRLDARPTEFRNDFGMAWGMGGWLLFPFLQKIGPEGVAKLKQRVADELSTTFASDYAREISLAEMLQPDVIAAYASRSTGQKFLIDPAKDLPALPGL